MSNFDVTIHMLVKNEDIFVGYALESVLPFINHAIIYDTGSSDTTASVIKSRISYFKKQNTKLDVRFEQYTVERPQELTKLRQKQLQVTTTDWFMLLDGDEIWPKEQLLQMLHLTKELPDTILAVVNQTRNCVGDVWHYMSDRLGQYSFLGTVGHFNIRLMRQNNYQLIGDYPNEAYALNGEIINKNNKVLHVSDSWYLHTSHLVRSSKRDVVLGRRKIVYSRGVSLSKRELPEVMQSSIWPRRGLGYELKSSLYDLGRNIWQSNM